MPDAGRLPLFIVACAVLIITPGPAVLYIVARSVAHGRRAGLVSACSIQLGTSFHVVAATLGLSTLLRSSALAFNLVKYLGAAYLIYLGVRTLCAPAAIPLASSSEPHDLRRIFAQGVIVATLNPKTALFFAAFLPQFVDSSRAGIASQMLVLGGIFVAVAATSDSLYALLAGSVGQWLKASSFRVGRYMAGSMYVGLGIAAALAGIRWH